MKRATLAALACLILSAPAAHAATSPARQPVPAVAVDPRAPVPALTLWRLFWLRFQP